MELSEFVKQSLTQIVSGVKASQDEIRNQGGYVNPAIFASSPGNAGTTHFGSVGDGQNVLLVDFDVAVTVTDTVEGGAGGKLSVASFFKVEAGGKGSTASEATSRILFKVPLALPVDPITKKKLEAEIAAQNRAVRVSDY
ncbi:MAG: trypco2 family protein [Thiobacillus sp.]|nr:trypco2 family protein [Thiobacillus sp.]